MSKRFKTGNTQWFVLCDDGLEIVNNGGSLCLMTSYSDRLGIVNPNDPGQNVMYVVSRDGKNNPVGKRFRFDESFRRLMTRETDKDFNGISQYNWLKNYPNCEGSPYGEYVENADGTVTQLAVWFRELNDAKDAETALQADEVRIRAQAEALELDNDTLAEVGALIGQYGDPDKLMRLKVVEFAGKKPSQFEKMLKSGDRGVRATVRRALADGVLKTKGSVIYWDETLIGADEDAAVAAFIREPDMYNAVREKLGLTITVPSEPKKPRGNPNFRKQKSDAL
jgi:hypothetical protein